MDRSREMIFSRRFIMVMTPIGVAIGLHEAWRLAGGLVILMAAQMLVLGLVMWALVRTIRRESAETRAAEAAANEQENAR